MSSLTGDTTTMLRDNLDRLRQLESAAEQLAAAAAEARRLLVEAVVAGDQIHEGGPTDPAPTPV
jgi:hypothetical protein